MPRISELAAAVAGTIGKLALVQSGITRAFDGGWGFWTPTLSAYVNLDATTAYECMYKQFGDLVFFAGKLDADPTASGAEASLKMSLPVASAFTASHDAAGTAQIVGGAAETGGAALFADATADLIQMRWITQGAANRAWYFHGMYRKR